MRFVSVVAALIVATSFPAWASENTINVVSVSNPELISALQDVKEALMKRRTPLLFENGETVNNCSEYTDLLFDMKPTETVRNSEIRSEYLICDSMRIISSNPFRMQRKKVSDSLVKELFEKLDLRSFPSSLRNTTTDEKFTLKALVNAKVKPQDSTLEVDTATNSFRMEVVAVVQQGKNLPQVWIVWMADEVKGGNYKSYRTLIVNRPAKPSRHLTATLYPN